MLLVLSYSSITEQRLLHLKQSFTTHPNSPVLDVSALEDNTVDLFGKTVNDLQSNVSIENGVATGDLIYIEDYTSAGFDMSQGNHFVVLQATSPGSTISFTFNGKTKTLDEDGILVLQMTEAKKAMKIKYTAVKPNGDSNTVEIALSDLTLQAQ